MIKKRAMAQDKWDQDVGVKRLIIDSGTVLGTQYKTVQPLGHDWYNMEDWVLATMGRSGSVWHLRQEGLARWYMNDGRFWFRDARDLNMFILKWSQ